MTRHILRSFPYTRSDDFATWLSEMAAKGWIFTRFGAGLIFEKAEPQKITYAVDAFLPGSEMDTRPEPQTEEFAEYCRAAGWEMVDAKQRYCVFRKTREDAVPIQTDEEKVENAYRAERKRILSECGAAPFLAAMYAFMIWQRAELMLFNGIYFFALAVWCYAAIAGLVRLIALSGWKRRMQQALTQGDEIYLGSHKTALGPGEIVSRWLMPAALLLFLLTVALPDRPELIGILVITLLMLTVLIFLINVLRPSRGENWAIQLAFGIAIPILIVFFVIAGALSGGHENSVADLEKYPFSAVDYRTVDGELLSVDGGTMRSPLGQVTECWISYGTPGFAEEREAAMVGQTEEEADAIYEAMQDPTATDIDYYLYRSRFPKVLDLVEKRMRKRYDFLPEGSAAFARAHFGADSPDSPQVYLIRGNETLLVLRERVQLPEEEGARLVEIVNAVQE